MLTSATLGNMLAIVAHNNVIAVGGVLVYMVHKAEADLLGHGDGRGTGALARRGSLQNASVSTRDSVHKTHKRRDDDDGGDGDVDAVKKREERAGANEMRNN